MKKISLLCLLLSLYKFGYTQTCQNCGVNQSNPQASLHVKGCGSTNSTFGFKVSNSLNKTALFVHDDLKTGIGAASNLYQLEVSDTAATSGVQTIMRIANRYIATTNNGSQLLFGANRTTSGMTNIAGVSGVISDISSSAYKGALVFSTANNAAPAERMRVDHLGNVGIGALPEDKLHVGLANTKAVIGSAGGENIGFGTSYLAFNASRQNESTWSTSGDAYNNGGALIYGTIYGGIRFSTIPSNGPAGQTGITDATIASQTRMTILKDGKIGVGTVSPENLLHVSGSNDWNILMRSSSLTAGRNNVLIQRSLGAGAVTAGAVLGGVSISGYDGSTYAAGWNGGAEIVALSTENWTSTARGTALIFTTSSNGTTSAPERVRINPDGNLGVGTTIPYYKIEAAGDIYANQGALMTSYSSSAGGRIGVYNHTKTGREMIVYTTYNMTSTGFPAYGNKYSIWGYPAGGGLGRERYSIWDNGDFTFHDSSGVERVKFSSNGTVGIGKTDPKSKLETGGSFGAKVVKITGSATAGDETVILIEISSANTTLALPDASVIPNRIYMIKRIDNSGYTCTIDPSGSQTIDGTTTKTLAYLNSMTIVAQNGNWYILQ